MKFDWKNCKETLPKSSGFYFVKTHNEVVICYYCKPIEKFVEFEYDYVCIYCWEPSEYMEWAKMPRFSKSKLLHDGYVMVEGKYIERR